jgi:ankyrin repeat protein
MVVDYDGLKDGLPLAIRELEAAIDQAAGTERWIDRKGDLLAVLNQEKWDFAAPSAENRSLYVQAITLGNQPLIQTFLSAHAPALTVIGSGAPPVCVASRVGSLSLVREMLRSGEKLAPEVKDRCLVDAAISGETEMLNFWLDQGADPKAKIRYPHNDDDPGGWMEQQGLLVNAVESGNAELLEKVLSFKFDVNQKFQNESLVWWAIERVRDGRKTAEVVELLLHSGADPHVRDTQRADTTPLFECGFKPEVVEPLVRAGADVNARDQNGTTPLIRNAFIEPFVRELLAHGADPSLANERGETALSVANQDQCHACAELIQEALSRRSGAAAKLN